MVVFEVEVIKVFLLVMTRISGLLVTAPVLGSGNFPMRAKAGLAILVAMLVTPTLPALSEPIPSDPVGFGVMALGEVSIGLLIGLVMTLTFAAIQVAGQIIDMLSGFAMMNVFNPAMETQVPIFGFFLFILAALYLLAINGDHLMLRSIVSTFEVVPLGGFAVRPQLMMELSTWGRAVFLDGLLIAAPVAGALFLAYVTMGLMGRVVPQIHLFAVGFPVTIALGLLVTSLFIGIYATMLDGMFWRMFHGIDGLIRGMT